MDEMFMENKSSINKNKLQLNSILYDIFVDIQTNLVLRFSVV